jgi:outer membrane receptor protein involved in Fe transport
MSKRVIAAARVASGVLCMTAIAAAAQQAAQPAADTSSSVSSGDTQQIVVTAQKRKEDIRKVPLSVSVMSAEQLQANQVADFSDLTRNVPNVSFNSQGGAGLSTIEIRGVSSQAGQATVSVYLDDVSLTTRNLYSQGTAEPRFFDIDRVEVLRGPQGTLYGASSLGGTIKFISKQPDAKHFSGSGLVDVSSTSHGGTNYEVEAVVNVPLVKDGVALRVGVQSGHDSGYIDRLDPYTLATLDKGINSTHWDVAKLALKADLGNGWSVTPAVFMQRFKSDDIDASFLKVGDSSVGYQVGPDPAHPNPNVDKPLAPFQTSKDLREPSTDTLTVPSLTVNGDLGFADFTGILSGYTRRFDRIQDGTLVNSTYIGTQVTDATLGALVGTLPSAVQLNNKIDQTSVELRLASKDYDASRSPITWVAGVYTAQTKTQVFDNEPVFGINAAFQAAGKDITNPNDLAGAFVNDFVGDSSYYSARHYNDKQESVFGELTYHFSPSLRGIVGVRMLHATQHFTREGDYYFTSCKTSDPFICPTTAEADGSWNATTPRFALDWDVDSNNTLYTNVAKGFRLGSANRPVPMSSAVQDDLNTLHLPGTIPKAFNPDSLWSFEVGSKSRLWNNRLNLNLAAYYLDWKDIQQDVVLPTSGFDFETNAGGAKSYGLEMDARWRATDDLTLNLAAGFTHAVFKEDVPALGFQDNQFTIPNVHKGDRVQGVPSYSARAGFTYHYELGENMGGFVTANGQWTGSSRGNLVPGSTDYERPSYFTADASTGVTYNRWTLTLYAKNLNNNQTILQRPSVQSVVEAYRLRPRTIGLTLSADI